jgi:hypothetical protein
MNNRLPALLILLMCISTSNIASAYTDYSTVKARESSVLVKVSSLLDSGTDINAIAITSNLLLVTTASVSRVSLDITIDGKKATVVETYNKEGLALLSYPTGGLSPALFAKEAGQSRRIIHLTNHTGDELSGTLLKSTTDKSSQIDMSISPALLSFTGSAVFNNCGEIIGIYDSTKGSKVASAISLPLINSAIGSVSGIQYSLTNCPSEVDKRAIEEEVRATENARIEAVAEAKQQSMNEELRAAREKTAQQVKVAENDLAEADKKSRESLEEAQTALVLAQEQKATAEAEKTATEAEKVATEEALRISEAAAVSAASEEAERNRKLLIMGGIALGLLLIAGIGIYYFRSRRSSAADNDDLHEPKEGAVFSYDVLIRGAEVGIKVPAELIARPRGVVVGRSAIDSDFVIDSPELSRSHIRLSEKDGILYIEDLGSANGTILNGLKLPPANLVALHHGDELELAVSIFSVELQERQ